MSSKLSVLSSFSDKTKERVLNYLKLADSAHDFKGQRSDTNITTNQQYINLLAEYEISEISPSTIEHVAQNKILERTDSMDEKNKLSKLINNSEYNFEITINNELNDSREDRAITSIYMNKKQVIKELKLNIQFDRILHGNKQKNKKFFSKAVLDYFKSKYNDIYGTRNTEYLVDAANIPISHFLSSTSSHTTYTQLIDESNKWDMAPTSAPDNFRNRCENLNFDSNENDWSINSAETIVTSVDGEITTIYNNTDINNISIITIRISSNIFYQFKHTFLNDSNYSYILLKHGEYNMNTCDESKTIPILSKNVKCFTVKLLVGDLENNCYGYIVFMNDDENICLMASNAYRKTQDNSIGVSTLSTYFKKPHQDLIDIARHLSCDVYTLILDIKRTGDWSQIIQVNNQYINKRQITFISLDYLAILFAKLINIPYIHTTLNEHFVSFTMRNAELAEIPTPQEIFRNLIDKIDNLIHKYNLYLQSDFFTNYKQIYEQLKTLFQTEYKFTIINNSKFVNNIFKFMHNVINNVFLQHINNINSFYTLKDNFEKIKIKNPINYDDNISLNSIYIDIEKKYLLIENINSELDIDASNLRDLIQLNSMPDTTQKLSLSKLDAIKKKFLFNITIMKGNMNFAKSFIFLIDKLIDLNNITPTSLERLAIKNQKLKNEIILNIYKQIISIINKIHFYNGIEPIKDISSQFSLDYRYNIQNINEVLTTFQQNTDKIPIFEIADSQGTVIMEGGSKKNTSVGGIFGLFGKKTVQIRQLSSNWRDDTEKAFRSNNFHYKNNKVSKPNIIHKLNFYYSTLTMDSSTINFNIKHLYGSITKTLTSNLVSNKNNIVLTYFNKNRESARTTNYVLEYNIIEKNQNGETLFKPLKTANNLHIVARKFFLLFAEKIFIQRINKFLRHRQYTLVQPINLEIAQNTTYLNIDSVEYDNLVNKLDVKIENKNTFVHDDYNYLYYDFLYFINLPLYEETFNDIKNQIKYGNLIQILMRKILIVKHAIASYIIPYRNYSQYLITDDNTPIDKEEYINNITDMLINDETYEKLKNLDYNIEIITNNDTNIITSEYHQWHTHLLLFTDILEKIELNRVIVFGIEETDGGGYSNNNNKYICSENLRQVYISLKYLVSIHDDVLYSFEAQTFKNICHFFDIDIPEDIDVSKRVNIKKIIIFINKIFVKRYLYIKQDFIENQIYIDWEKEDINNFFQYYDMYTTIKDYQNIVNEIDELMINDIYDVEYCVKQLWGSIESLDFYVEQYFRYKYNDNLILSHQGEFVNSDVYISTITNNTLLKEVDKLPKVSEKKTVLLEDIIQNIENGKYSQETLKSFIDYLISHIDDSLVKKQQVVDERPYTETSYKYHEILGYGGSLIPNTIRNIKKHSCKKK